MRHLVFVVGGDQRSVPKTWWVQLEGPRPDPPFPTDGCSCSPDSWRGRILWPACIVHDYHYRTGILGGTWRDRAAADGKFRRNASLLLRLQGMSASHAHAVAWFYWGRVRIWGRKAYPLSGVALPFWRRVKDAWRL